MSSSTKQLVWLVTGTSSGFGREFVLAALARGEKVIATARTRSVNKLEDLRAKGAAVLELDAAWPTDKIKEVVEKAESIHGRIDVLFNNAGYAVVNSIEETTPEETSDIFSANVFGGLNLARAVLPGMRARNEGTILWNGSFTGWQPGTGIGLYSATKATVRGTPLPWSCAMALVLHAEISSFGLRSLVLEPGYFRTSIVDNLDLYKPRIAEYEPLIGEIYRVYQASSAYLPGDPKRGVEVIIDLVRVEGFAQGRDVPINLTLGTDGHDGIKSVCEDMLKTLADWKDVIVSTDIPK